MKADHFSLRQPGGGVEFAAEVVLRYMKATGYVPVFAIWFDRADYNSTLKEDRVHGHFHCVGVKR